jgi:hypothetical protein
VNINGAYREVALEALPRCDVTDDIEQVEDFIHAKKPTAYFSVA